MIADYMTLYDCRLLSNYEKKVRRSARYVLCEVAALVASSCCSTNLTAPWMVVNGFSNFGLRGGAEASC